MDASNGVGVGYLDFEKTFDSVNHRKFHAICMTCSALLYTWITSTLCPGSIPFIICCAGTCLKCSSLGSICMLNENRIKCVGDAYMVCLSLDILIANA